MQIPFTPVPRKQIKFNKQGYNRQDFEMGMPDIIKLCSVVCICLFLMVSCSSKSGDCAQSQQLLQDQITAKDQRIAVLEDSLQKAINPSGLVDVASITQNADTNEYSFYKDTKSSHKASTVVTDKKYRDQYPGQFPEGSSRILTDHDLKFLSHWGIKVMLNEIYARHGVLFTDKDKDLQQHFKREGWYHGANNTVDGLLSDTERKNIIFINNYKYDPETSS